MLGCDSGHFVLARCISHFKHFGLLKFCCLGLLGNPGWVCGSKQVVSSLLKELKYKTVMHSQQYAFLLFRAGPGTQTVAQQLSFCTNEMQCLLSEMKGAIQGVKSLTLKVVHRRVILRQLRMAASSLTVQTTLKPKHHRQQRQQQQRGLRSKAAVEQYQAQKFEESFPPKPFAMTCPVELGTVCGSVFAMLADSVPNLRKLCLRGCCWDAALNAFGISCPLLDTLDIEVPHVPVQALRDFGKHLPNLVSVTAGNRRCVCKSDEPHIGLWMDIFLPSTQHCRRLTSLSLEFPAGCTLTCQPDVWKHVPTSLKHLQCGILLVQSDAFLELIRQMPSLCMEADSVGDLCQLFQHATLLERLEIMDSQAASLHCGGDESAPAPSGLTMLKERFINGRFSLVCGGMSFIGTDEDVREVFKWLPQIPGIRQVELVCVGSMQPRCLEDVQRLFPEVREIILEGSEGDEGEWDMEVLKPLATMSAVEHLELQCPQLVLTLPGLVQLCSSMEGLRELLLGADLCEDLNESDISAAIQGLGLGIKVFIN